jgi:hypothetical protein
MQRLIERAHRLAAAGLIFARPNASIIFTSHGMLISPADFYYDIGTKNRQFCDAA